MIANGKLIIGGHIKTATGLHIGAASTGLEIGGVDKVVVRNPLDNLPYIPGSSLKGKLRALLERASGFAEPTKRVWVKRDEISMHLCNDPLCYVCNIFGRNNAEMTPVVGARFKITCTTPTRLAVRDSKLIKSSLAGAQTDLPYTEVKWEVGIDRITSQANPRQMERVPAGALFDLEMVYTVFEPADRDNLIHLFEAMAWLEDDYLGGQGSRGAGKVVFEGLKLDWRPARFYETGNTSDAVQNINDGNQTVATVLANFNGIKEKIAAGGR